MIHWLRNGWRRLLLLFARPLHYVRGGSLPAPYTKEEEARLMQRLLEGDESVRQGLSSTTCAWWSISRASLRTRAWA